MNGYIKRSGWFAAALLGCLMLAPSVQAASFDCATSMDDVEKTICKNAELSKLDERLSAVYKKALVGAPEPGQLKKEQRTWLKIRNEACYVLMGQTTLLSTYPDEDCLIDLYRDRIETLEYEASRSMTERKRAWASEASLSMAAPLGERFEIHPMHESDRNLGHGYAVCEAMVRWANRNPDEMICPAEVARTLPGIEDVEWQSLDPKAHEELIHKIYLFATLHSLAIKGRFNSWEVYSKGSKSDKWPNDEFLQKLPSRVKADIAAGLKMWVYRGEMFFDWTVGARKVTVIRMERPDAHCLWNGSKPVTGSIAFVASDLKELDESVNSHASFNTGPRMLKRYKGQIILINALNDAMLSIERNYGHDFCVISENPTYWRNK